jgi:hypothetical protein
MFIKTSLFDIVYELKKRFARLFCRNRYLKKKLKYIIFDVKVGEVNFDLDPVKLELKY